MWYFIDNAFHGHRVQFKKPLDVLVSLFCPGNSLDKDAVVFSNGPSNDPAECSFRSRDGASIEFEMTVTDQVGSLSIQASFGN